MSMIKGVKKIGLASDHGGFYMKETVKEFLKKWAPDVEIIDYGTDSTASVDYPDYAQKLARAVQSGEVDYGVASCGTANGISMTLNRYEGVRAGIVWNEEITELIRKHNDANILAIPGRFVSLNDGLKFVERFFSTEFEGGRHQRRIDKIHCK